MTEQANLLFVALSDSQEKYYRALSEHPTINGHILRIKHFPHGSFLNGYNWIKKHQINPSQWLSFKILKESSNHRFYGFKWLFKLGLYIDVLRFTDAFNKKLSELSLDAIVVLNGAHYKQQAAISAAKTVGIKTLYLELGCLPNTTTIDPKGVNYNNALPRDAEFYRHYKPNPSFKLPSSLIARPSVKSVNANTDLPSKYLFVPFQVHDDTQILLQSPWIKSMNRLYQTLVSAVEKLDKSIYFVIKEHPSDKQRFDHLHKKNKRIIFANGNNTEELIKQAEAVITINSTVGIEALMLGKPVITVGNAFYNINGLVAHASDQETFNQLIANFPEITHDEDLVTRFIAYLQESYLVAGRHKQFDSTHINLMVEAMKNALNYS